MAIDLARLRWHLHRWWHQHYTGYVESRSTPPTFICGCGKSWPSHSNSTGFKP